MDLAEIAHEPETELARWTADEFVELLNEGFVTDRRIELLDGLMVKEMPQRPIHSFVFFALQETFGAANAAASGLRTTPTLVLSNRSVVEPNLL